MLRCPDCREEAVELMEVREHWTAYHSQSGERTDNGFGQHIRFEARCYRCSYRWRPRNAKACVAIVVHGTVPNES